MSELTSERIEELRRVAEAATPGPWEWRHKSRTLHTQSNRREPYKYGSLVMWQETTVDGDREIEAKGEDFDYIERMDPSTVLALLDELERLRKLVAKADSTLSYLRHRAEIDWPVGTLTLRECDELIGNLRRARSGDIG